jgi:hypothetical protein
LRADTKLCGERRVVEGDQDQVCGGECSAEGLGAEGAGRGAIFPRIDQCGSEGGCGWRPPSRESRQGVSDIDEKLERLLLNDYCLQAQLDVIIKNEDLLLRNDRLILRLLQRLPTGMAIDIIGDHMSTVAGTTSNFQQLYTPSGSVAPAGTTQKWSVDVTDITLTPSADGTTCQAAVPATETATSYNLTCTSSYTPPGATGPITDTINVPITPAVPTPTGMTINQLS